MRYEREAGAQRVLGLPPLVPISRTACLAEPTYALAASLLRSVLESGPSRAAPP